MQIVPGTVNSWELEDTSDPEAEITLIGPKLNGRRLTAVIYVGDGSLRSMTAWLLDGTCFYISGGISA